MSNECWLDFAMKRKKEKKANEAARVGLDFARAYQSLETINGMLEYEDSDRRAYATHKLFSHDYDGDRKLASYLQMIPRPYESVRDMDLLYLHGLKYGHINHDKGGTQKTRGPGVLKSK